MMSNKKNTLKGDLAQIIRGLLISPNNFLDYFGSKTFIPLNALTVISVARDPLPWFRFHHRTALLNAVGQLPALTVTSTG
jgi:hypothetical protein